MASAGGENEKSVSTLLPSSSYTVEFDRAGLWKTLFCYGQMFWCVGGICASPCIKCYTDTQQVNIDDRSIHISYDLGCCGKTERSVPLDRIQDITLSTNCISKCFNVSTVDIQTAGGNPQAGPEIRIIAPANATMVRDLIRDRRDAAVGHAGDGTSNVAVSDGMGGISTKSPLLGSNAELVEMRDSLKRLEVLVKNGVDKM